MLEFSMTAAALMVIAACLLDRLLGETKHFHPLVGFGQLAKLCERHFNLTALYESEARRRGLFCWCLLVVMPTITISFAITLFDDILQMLSSIIVLYITIGGRSLQEHADRVRADLEKGDLTAARTHVSWLVSRDTSGLDETGISKACIESVLENGNDALFAPIFWFCVLGPAGAVMYRLANTLDAMWGYRTPRYLNFGRTAAKLDDALNYLPARLTALSYALIGHTRSAIHCWKTQAPLWDSPNAGPVMAAGAGAMNVRLGGAANYHGATEHRPQLGCGNTPKATDIGIAQRIQRKALWLWLATLSFAATLSLIF